MKMIIKEEQGSVVIYDITDFKLADILDCGQCFRFYENDDGSFSGMAGDRFLKISQSDNRLIFTDITMEEFNGFFREYFDIDRDYGKIKKYLSYDEILRKASAYGSGIRILKQDSWEALCSFIISQNNNIKRIKKIIKALCEYCGPEISGGHHAFPSAEAILKLLPEELKDLGFGFRASYIHDAAQKVYSKEIDLELVSKMPINEARKELMKIKGVGPKVAECTLLYGMFRLEAFPIDVWIKRAIDVFYGGEIPQFAAKYAGIAQQYIFHYIRTCPEALEDAEHKSSKMVV